MESPFKHYFNTNYAPPIAEVHQIREFISQPLRELASLNDKITQMQSIIADLARERDTILDHINAHRALISPARRLSPELVQEIFIHCLPMTRNAVMSAQEAPVLLGRICSGWRRIALSTPSLWSSVHIVSPIGLTAHEKFSQRFDCLNAWLGRSGALPLSISVVTPMQSTQNACKIVASLIPLSPRWKSISLRVPRIALHPVLDLTMEDVPMLEAIKLHDFQVTSRRDETPWQAGVPRTKVSIFGASRLHSASFPHFDGDPLGLPLPWAQLIELCFTTNNHTRHAINAAMALHLLSQCPNLISCTLTIAAGSRVLNTNITPPNDPITLPFLRSFHSERSENTDFFDHLILPELHDISIRQSLGSRTPEHIAFRSLLIRSHSLRSIALKHPYLAPDDLIECLQLAPSITRLHLAGLDLRPDLEKRLFCHLTPTRDRPGLCSALETIEIVGCSELSIEVLLGFLQAKLSPVRPDVARLRHVQISHIRSKSLDLFSQLRPHVQPGTQVSFTYSSTEPC